MRIAGGGPEASSAADELHRRLFPLLRNHCLRRAPGDEERAERLAQDVVVTLWIRLQAGTIDPVAIPVSHYVWGIARILQRRDRETRLRDLPGELDPLDWHPASEDVRAFRELLEALADCVRRDGPQWSLEARERAAVEAFLRSIQAKVAAAEIGRDPAAMTRAKESALQKLRKCLEEKGYVDEDGELLTRLTGGAPPGASGSGMKDDEIELLLEAREAIEAFERATPARAADPDCVSFARCREIAGTRSFATRGERAHLERCRECRGRVEAFRRLEPASNRSGLRARRLWLVGGLAAAAALVLAALALLREGSERRAPGVEIALASHPADLFRDLRSADGPELYVGVQVEEASYVRLVFVDDRGRSFPMAIDEGRDTERIPAGGAASYGSYARSWSTSDGERRLEWVVALISEAPIETSALETALEGEPSLPQSAAEIERFAERLAGHFGGVVRALAADG